MRHCMVMGYHYFSVIAPASEPIHAFLEFYLQVLLIISFPSHWLLFPLCKAIVETIDKGEGRMNRGLLDRHGVFASRLVTEFWNC